MTGNKVAIARDAFERIAREHPNLDMRIHNDFEPLDLQMDIPIQAGLKFEISLDLQNDDELNISVGHFQLAWFPCTRPDRVEDYIKAVRGLISGEYRILEHYRGEGVVRAELQTPQNHKWKTIGTWGKLSLPIHKKRYQIISNA